MDVRQFIVVECWPVELSDGCFRFGWIVFVLHFRSHVVCMSIGIRIVIVVVRIVVVVVDGHCTGLDTGSIVRSRLLISLCLCCNYVTKLMTFNYVTNDFDRSILICLVN